MAAQNYWSLTFDVEYGGSIGTKTLTFEGGVGEPGKANVEEGIPIDWLAQNRFSGILGFVQSQLDESTDMRRGVHVDIGGGEHIWTVDWQSPGTTPKPGGGLFQWGSSANAADGPNKHTATGADPWAQQYLFNKALVQDTIDSLTPATFSVGEWSPDGIEGTAVEVVVGSVNTNYPNNQPKKFDGTFMAVATASLDDAIDAVENDER